jgi:hypothetical protein
MTTTSTIYSKGICRSCRRRCGDAHHLCVSAQSHQSFRSCGVRSGEGSNDQAHSRVVPAWYPSITERRKNDPNVERFSWQTICRGNVDAPFSFQRTKASPNVPALRDGPPRTLTDLRLLRIGQRPSLREGLLALVRSTDLRKVRGIWPIHKSNVGVYNLQHNSPNIE